MGDPAFTGCDYRVDAGFFMPITDPATEHPNQTQKTPGSCEPGVTEGSEPTECSTQTTNGVTVRRCVADVNGYYLGRRGGYARDDGATERGLPTETYVTGRVAATGTGDGAGTTGLGSTGVSGTDDGA